MPECNAFSLYTSFEATEKCRPEVERKNKQPYVTVPLKGVMEPLELAYNIPPTFDTSSPSQSYFYELKPVSWCHDNAEFTFPLNFNTANAGRCCKLLIDITKQTCEVEILPRSWLANAARVKLK